MTRLDRLIALAHSGKPPLIDVLVRIGQRPHHSVVVDRPLVHVGELSAADTEALAQALGDNDSVMPCSAAEADFAVRGKPYRFTKLYDVRPRTTQDTTPNRFLRRFALRYRTALLQAGKTSDSDAVVARLDRLLGMFKHLSAMRGAGTGDPVMQHDPLYRRVLAASIDLSRILNETAR